MVMDHILRILRPDSEKHGGPMCIFAHISNYSTVEIEKDKAGKATA